MEGVVLFAAVAGVDKVVVVVVVVLVVVVEDGDLACRTLEQPQDTCSTRSIPALARTALLKSMMNK